MKNKKGNTAVIAVIVVIVAITFAVIGYLFAKKSQAPAAQPVAVAPIAPVVQTQPAAPSLQPLVAGVQGAVYTNTDYGFQFIMPQDWMNIIGDYKAVESKMGDGTPFVEFAAKATDNDWLDNQEVGFPKGYADLFEIGIVKKTDWDNDVKTCDKKTQPCLSSHAALGENNENVFVLWLPNAGPSNFTMFSDAEAKIEDPTNLIKSGFKLAN